MYPKLKAAFKVRSRTIVFFWAIFSLVFHLVHRTCRGSLEHYATIRGIELHPAVI